MKNLKLIEIKECPVHGLTEFVFYESSSHHGLFRCKKCESELAVLKKLKLKLKSVEYKGPTEKFMISI